jgi:hypothetical protein
LAGDSNDGDVLLPLLADTGPLFADLSSHQSPIVRLFRRPWDAGKRCRPLA